MAFAQVGKVAPAFTLLDQRGNKVSLKQFRDVKNVVLYFYPKAMTPGCTVQACGIRDTKAEFDALDTVVLAVSPDSVDRLVKFEDKQELNFTLLSDEDHASYRKVWCLGYEEVYGPRIYGRSALHLHYWQRRPHRPCDGKGKN